MGFYLLRRPARKDDRVPLGVSEEHQGCIIVRCAHCGVIGVLPHRIGGKVDLEIEIKDVAYLDDIEQAFTKLLVSKKYRDAVMSHGLTGIEFYPPLGYRLKTKKKGAEEMIIKCRDHFQFQAIHVTGRGGSIAKTSGVRLRKSCEKCGWEEWTLPENGIYVDEKQWDGTDFFYVDEFGSMLMSQRAVDALSQAQLSNFAAQPAEEYRIFPG